MNKLEIIYVYLISAKTISKYNFDRDKETLFS